MMPLHILVQPGKVIIEVSLEEQIGVEWIIQERRANERNLPIRHDIKHKIRTSVKTSYIRRNVRHTRHLFRTVVCRNSSYHLAGQCARGPPLLDWLCIAETAVQI